MNRIITLSGDHVLECDTVLENVTLTAEGGRARIVCAGHSLCIGEGVKTEGEISITAVSEGTPAADMKIELHSGKWHTVQGCALRGERAECDRIDIILDGGEVECVHMLGSCAYTCPDTHVSFTLRDGSVNAGVYGTDTYSSARASVNIAGGMIIGDVKAHPQGVECGIRWSVNITGGSLSRLSVLSGKGAGEASVTFDGVDPTAEEQGQIEFQNPIRRGPDPWITYWEGYYYYTATMGAAGLHVWKAPNLTDLHRTTPKTVYIPDPECEFKGLWSPEIHYFAADDFGAEFEGWYLYLAGNRKNAEGNAMPVMFVMKSLDGKPDGQYGHPLTGEANKYISIDSCADIDFTRIWAVGQTIARINGKVYSLFVTESGRQTKDFVQHINIAEMSNPYTFGTPHIIISPTHEYEFHGHTYSKEKDKWWPKVVEGSTAIYVDDSVYIAFSGSGYWTTYYCLAQIRYNGGDPLDINSYRKDDKPFLVREKTLHEKSINGCGHASYICDFDGRRWCCYHAYIGVDTSSGRYSFLEPVDVDADGNIIIGAGTGHPAPIDTTYTLTVNPMPLCYKTEGFDNYTCKSKYEDRYILSDEVRLAKKM